MLLVAIRSQSQVVNGRLLSVRLVESHCLHIGDEAGTVGDSHSHGKTQFIEAINGAFCLFCLKVIDIAEISIQLRGTVPLPGWSGISNMLHMLFI